MDIESKNENIENTEITGSKKIKRGKIGIKLFIFIFFLVYSYLQIGFSGLYTYTKISVLYTCLMYFSIFALYTMIWAFFKFRKKQFTEIEIKKILKTVLKSVIVIIVMYSFMYIFTYISNMNGIINAKENYSVHTKKIQNIVEKDEFTNTIENTMENTVNNNDVVNNEKTEILESMLDYNTAVTELDRLYSGMKDKMWLYIGLRILTDIIDIFATVIVVFVAKIFIYKIVVIKDEKEEI